LLLCLTTIVFCFDLQTEEARSFANFVATHNKKYDSATEMTRRFLIFQENLKIAAKLDAEDEHATYGVTKFMDLTQAEFKQMYLIQNFTSPKKEGKPYNVLPKATVDERALPAKFDWRNKGNVVTPVYNQQQCGSCWAFSTTENVESMWALAGHGLTQLSMQQLVDCSGAYGNEGCNGGNTVWSYPYIINNGGLDSYASYPYVAEDQTCMWNPANVAATISNWGYITQNDNVPEMRTWMYQNGPPSICVDAQIWQYYTGGVITANCGNEIDHCVQLMGWEDISGVPAWIIRNSWGTSWGYSGYLYVARANNLCDIGSEVTSSVI